MTPISFALEILLDCETIEEAHKKCRKYIKELEKSQGQGQPMRAITHPGPPPNLAQAPSTLAALARQAGAEAPAHQAPRAVIPMVPPGAPINNGDGTVGKKKW